MNMHGLTSYDLNKSNILKRRKHLGPTHAALNKCKQQHGSKWFTGYKDIIANIVFKHHMNFTYISSNAHMNHNSKQHQNPHITSLQIINHAIDIFHHNSRINPISSTQNRSLAARLWQSETALLAVASWSARPRELNWGHSPLASWGRTGSEQYWVLSAFFTFFNQKRRL